MLQSVFSPRGKHEAYHRYYESIEKTEFALFPRNDGSDDETTGHHITVSRDITKGFIIVRHERRNRLMSKS